jgi:arginyl-tRNA synthetase
MESLISLLKQSLSNYFKASFPDAEPSDFVFQPTNKDHGGHLTLMVFPLAKLVKLNPDSLAGQLGEHLKNTEWVDNYEVIKGFLNLHLSKQAFQILLTDASDLEVKINNIQKIVLEYCGPNTNKPIHIGHLRNMFLGYSVAGILKEVGHDVHKVNIFNDRGIAICKSMVGYLEYGNNTTPESEGMKGDFFVGKFYILFSQECSLQAKPFIEQGLKKEEAEAQTAIFQKANDLLLKWEDGDQATIDLWSRMNDWFYSGVRQTYDRLGIDSEKDYYESREYKKGKSIVEIGHQSGVFQKDETGAIFIDLTDKGLDKKFLQRSNGTSLYITQDMALVKQRFDDYHMDKMIYVVGDEQNYHFKVLKYIMEAMNENFSKDIYHLSYGMVLGKDGSKFKSREGTPADADLIVEAVVEEAKVQTMESGKAETLTENEINEIAESVGLGALKFALLKVTATKNIVFDPKEAVDLNGDTGSFIQYTYVRTKALLAKWEGNFESDINFELHKEEEQLILHLAGYKSNIKRCAEALDPAELALFTLQLAKIYNRFYTQLPILKEDNLNIRGFRMKLTKLTFDLLGKSLTILGVPLPNKM